MLGLLACGIAALAYQNGLDAPFVFDDRHAVLLNPTIAAPWDLRAILLHNVARPAVNLSYAIDMALWGLSSFGFHVTNLILHITVVGLFYGWCTRALTDATARSRAKTAGRGAEAGVPPEWPALVAAAIVAVHPVMSTTVMYVSARSELLAAIGFLGALTYARRAILASNQTAALMTAAFGLLAVASSSSAAALPLVILAYDAWVLRDNGWRRRAIRFYAPAAIALTIAAATQLPRILAADRIPPRGVITNFIAEIVVLGRYVALLVFPRAQALVHEVDYTPFGLVSLVLVALTAGLIAVAIRQRATQPLLAFGAVWFVGVLIPTMVVPVRDGMAEHRLYLAGEGLVLAAVSLAAAALATRVWIRGIFVAVITLLDVRTVDRNGLWLDPLPLFEESVSRSPGSWVAHRELAQILREAGLCGRAEAEFRAARELHPFLNADGALTGRCGYPETRH